MNIQLREQAAGSPHCRHTGADWRVEFEALCLSQFRARAIEAWRRYRAAHGECWMAASADYQQFLRDEARRLDALREKHAHRSDFEMIWSSIEAEAHIRRARKLGRLPAPRPLAVYIVDPGPIGGWVPANNRLHAPPIITGPDTDWQALWDTACRIWQHCRDLAGLAEWVASDITRGETDG